MYNVSCIDKTQAIRTNIQLVIQTLVIYIYISDTDTVDTDPFVTDSGKTVLVIQILVIQLLVKQILVIQYWRYS